MSANLDLNAANVVPGMPPDDVTTAPASLLDGPTPSPKAHFNGKGAAPAAHVTSRDAKVGRDGREYKGEEAMPENPEHMSAAERLLNRKQRDLEATESATVRDLARMFTVEAIETLVDVMQNVRAASPARVSAAAILIERGAGKPQNYFSPMRATIATMSATDAFAAILRAANAGEVSHEEVKVLSGLLEARSKGVEIEELSVRLAELEAQLEVASATANTRTTVAKMN